MRRFLVTLYLFSVVVVGAPQKPRPAFDVASIKTNKSGEAAASTIFPPGGRFSARNASLKLLIRLAYGVADYQISGGPDWIRFDKFDVEAKSEASPSVDVLGLMLQRLLEDRFQLRVHRATKQDEVYALVIAKGGLKMRAVSNDGTDTNRLRNDAWRGVKAGQGHLFTDKGEIAGLAAFLTQIMDRPVIDRTGLYGLFGFDFALPSNILPLPDSSESIFEAIQDQLGLRLERGRGTIDVLVIDGVERLSEN
jgi:uncharacterized protein (TIGR03435 family)